jgi:hypothetical protein
VLKKQGKNSMQNEELIGPGGCHVASPSLWCCPLLRCCLLDDYSFHVKKLYHKIISHLLSRVADIRGHKDNISATKKTPNKICCKVSRECIKLPTFTKYQKTQKESYWDSKKCSKQQKTKSANINSSSLMNFCAPLKYVTNFCYIFIQVDD